MAGAGRSSTIRVDKWLWTMRVFKTRTAANQACAAGRVQVNGEPAKPATKVAPGDEVTARRRDRTIVYGVLEIVPNRVSAARAAECVDDRSPPPPTRPATGDGPIGRPAGDRDRGAGRPTKRDRRQIDALRRRS